MKMRPHTVYDKKIIITSINEVKGKAKKVQDKSNSSSLSILENLSSIKTKEVVLFTKKLSTMTRAGLNILDTLQMAKNQVNDKKLKVIIEFITQDLQGGTDIAGSF